MGKLYKASARWIVLVPGLASALPGCVDAQATKTEVSARKNLVTWDKDYAQQLLTKIVNQKS